MIALRSFSVGLPSPQAPLTALLFSASTLLTSPLARATEAVLPFAFTDCAEAPLGGAALLGALRLESTHLLTDSALRLIEVRYHCDGHAHVRIDTGDEVIARDLFLQDAPLSERTRALALALAEETRDLGRLASPRAEALAAPPFITTPAPDETPPSTAPAATGPSPKNAFVGLALRAPLGSNTALLGALAAHRWERWSAGGTLVATREEANVSRQRLGSVTAVMVGARVAYRIAEVSLTPVHVELELVAGAGVVHVGGSASGAVATRDVYKPYGEAHLSVLLRLRTKEVIAPFLSADLGRSSGVVAEAAGHEILRTGGWFTGGALGLNF